MPEKVQYWTKLTQSGIFLVRYRTKIWDAGMPMPALVSLMPMPSYANGPLSRTGCVVSFYEDDIYLISDVILIVANLSLLYANETGTV
jgi:hypothetical protein